MPRDNTVGATPVSTLTRDLLGDLSASERKVGRALLSAYPVAGLETIAQLAARAQVSPPTVVRFVGRLGFGGYPEFQRALMHEVHERMGSPLAQYPDKHASNAEPADHGRSLFAQILNESFHELPETEFARAADLLSDGKRSTTLIGGRFSRVLADYLAFHLHLLRRGVTLLGADALEQYTVVESAGRSSVLAVFDYRRYDRGVATLAGELKERGATIILFTDPWLSPIAEYADVVIPARVEAPSAFDSLVPAMAIVESVVGAVAQRLGERGRTRIERIESIRDELSPYD
ncbi:MAG: MurR/RpiR family transcriptional regulator [Actinomycetia bacterium]|nr:MurR/RpiR family transcriptional regulator [Actinomycetes bacterium]